MLKVKVDFTFFNSITQVMFVQHSGGCAVQWNLLYSRRCISTVGGGGGNISTVGDNIST